MKHRQLSFQQEVWGVSPVLAPPGWGTQGSDGDGNNTNHAPGLSTPGCPGHEPCLPLAPSSLEDPGEQGGEEGTK